MKYFNKLGCQKVSIPYDATMMKSMVKSHFEKQLCVDGTVKKDLLYLLEDGLKNTEITSLYVKTYLNCLMPERLDSLELAEASFKKIQKCVDKVDKNKIKETRNSDQLFDYILDFWSHQIFSNEEQFKEILNLLVSTQKGLTKAEILSISKVDS